jgi:hypothetical protein
MEAFIECRRKKEKNQNRLNLEMRQSEQLAKEGTPAVSSIRIQFFPVFVKEIFFVQ